MTLRKTFLQGSLATLGTSYLHAKSNSPEKKNVKRCVFLCSSLGFLTKHFTPTPGAKNYESDFLKSFEDLQNDFSLFEGLSHAGLLGSFHQSERCFLTAARDASSPTFKNSVSIDQLISKQIGELTRFPHLNLSLGERGLVHNHAGVMLPPETNANRLYDALFKQKTQEQIREEKRQLELQQNILMASLKKKHSEHQLIKSFEHSAHLLDNSFQQRKAWLDQPKPKVEERYQHPQTHEAELLKRFENFLVAIRLAFQTDSTRVAVLHIPFYNKVPKITGVDTSWHRLTHMRNKKDKEKQLISIERRVLNMVAQFIRDLKSTSMGDHTLLDETVVLCGSNLGESNSHNPLNLPILCAGGDFNHGSVHRHDTNNNTPLSQLFLSIANHIEGVELKSFKKETQCLENFS